MAAMFYFFMATWQKQYMAMYVCVRVSRLFLKHTMSSIQ